MNEKNLLKRRRPRVIFHSGYSLSSCVSPQLYGRRAAWEDPAAWVIDTYPWSATPTPAEWPPLLQLRPEDVGFDGYSAPREGVRKEPLQSDSDADPLVSLTAPQGAVLDLEMNPSVLRFQTDARPFPTDEHADASEGGGDVIEPTELRQRLQQQQPPGRHPGLVTRVDPVMSSRGSAGICFQEELFRRAALTVRASCRV